MQKGFLPAAAPSPAAAVPQWAAPHYCTCPECGQVWALSYPESSWRGYFLPIAAASARYQQQQRLNRLRRFGCFGLLVLIGIWLAVQWR
ncbi:hypothetical protein [Hymenobacter amundsenii]|uniref:hypothetical protein n=1 Tax=Hymenobacter amundsenii TaxID=2006685 RepID=UPI000F816718|nr:hypothetical protein [Hymenobacter amundsenii]